MILAEQKKEPEDLEADLFVRRAMRLVNGIENAADAAWFQFDSSLNDRTGKANARMRALIAALPAHSDPKFAAQGYVDFRTAQGLRRRAKFFRDLKSVYDGWHQGITNDLQMSQFDWKADPWDKSLGLAAHKGGLYLQRIRDEVVRKSNELVSLLDHFKESAFSFPGIIEARTQKVKTTGGVISARITGRGLPKHHKTHSRTTSIILRGLKGIIDDQEKAMLENVFRGMDLLPRTHANAFYDASTGLTLRDALNRVADDFSVKQMSKQQLKLSVQTHIRAMMRRVAGESEAFREISGVDGFLRVPPTRVRDFARIPESVRREVFKIVKIKGQLLATKGSADSLGSYPGDKTQLVPIPKGELARVRKAAEKARQAYMKALDRYVDPGAISRDFGRRIRKPAPLTAKVF